MMNTSPVSISDVVIGVSKVCREPLRVLRAFQMAGIFEVTLSNEAQKVAENSVYDFRDLSIEEIWHEWQSWALHSVKPSMGLNLLDSTGWLEMFPLLFNMKGVPQNSKNHPEGDVWVHTKYVVDYARKVADRDNYSPEDRLALIFSALTHDIGKPDTTILDNSEWSAPKHDKHGAFLARKFLESIGAPEQLILKVEKLVRYHLVHVLNDVTTELVEETALKLLPAKMDTLFGLMESDNSGRPPHPVGLGSDAERMKLIYSHLDMEMIPYINEEIIKKLALQNKIPSVYSTDGLPETQLVIEEVTEAQYKRLVNSPVEAVQYVVDLLSPLYSSQHQNTVLFLAQQSMGDLANLASLELTEKEILEMTPEQISDLIYPANEE